MTARLLRRAARACYTAGDVLELVAYMACPTPEEYPTEARRGR